MKFLVFSVFLLLLLERGKGLKLKGDQKPDPPTITVDGYATADDSMVWNTNASMEIFGAGSNESVLVVPSAVRGLSLLCNASYPVEWTFHREKWNRRTTWQTAMVNTRGSDPETLQAKWFSSEVRFLGSNNEITGNYTCMQYGNEKVSQSVYVYWEGSSPPYLTLLQGGTHKRKVPFNAAKESEVVIPCMVSKPGILVTLLKNKTDITKNDGVRFDPTKGFIVKASGQDPSGTYTCQVGPEEDEDMLDFEVTLDQGEKKGEFEEFIQGSATFSYNATARQFVCCSDSSSDKPPKVGHYYCGHPTSCLLQKHALYKLESTPSRLTDGRCSTLTLRMLTAGVIRCKGEKIDVVREYFFPMMDYYWRFRRGNNSVAVQPYYNFQDPEIKRENLIMLTNLTTPFYVGETRRFVCRISHFYFSRGIHWRLSYTNETFIVQGNQTNAAKKHSYGIFFQGNYAVIQIKAAPELKSVTCLAPVWNTTEWINKTLSFNVQKPTPPKIEDPASQEITWSTQAKERVLMCKVEGAPTPKITWWKDGRRLRRAGKINGTISFNGTISYLNISKYSTQRATFFCNATNVGGNATKAFTVYVSDGVSAGRITLIVLGVLFVCLALVGGGFAVYKIVKQRAAIRHLANVAFKDVNDLAAQTGSQGQETGQSSNSGVNGRNGAGPGFLHAFGQSQSQGQNHAGNGSGTKDFGRFHKM